MKSVTELETEVGQPITLIGYDDKTFMLLLKKTGTPSTYTYGETDITTAIAESKHIGEIQGKVKFSLDDASIIMDNNGSIYKEVLFNVYEEVEGGFIGAHPKGRRGGSL